MFSCAQKKASVSSTQSSEIAKIIIDAENALKERNDKLQEENPQYNYHFNLVNEVHCLFILKNISDATADEMVQKHKISDTFPNAEIRASGVGTSFTIIFKRDDFTEDIHLKIKALAKSEPLVKTFYVTTERNYDYITLPKIEYYIDNAVPLKYEESNDLPLLNRLDRGFIIKSKAEYDEFMSLVLSSESSAHYKKQIEDKKDIYDESFFEENALIITKMIVRGSESIKLTVENLYICDNKVYAVVQTEYPGMGTRDMQYKSFILKVNKSDVINVDDVITLE